MMKKTSNKQNVIDFLLKENGKKSIMENMILKDETNESYIHNTSAENDIKNTTDIKINPKGFIISFVKKYGRFQSMPNGGCKRIMLRNLTDYHPLCYSKALTELNAQEEHNNSYSRPKQWYLDTWMICLDHIEYIVENFPDENDRRYRKHDLNFTWSEINKKNPSSGVRPCVYDWSDEEGNFDNLTLEEQYNIVDTLKAIEPQLKKQINESYIHILSSEDTFQKSTDDVIDGYEYSIPEFFEKVYSKLENIYKDVNDDFSKLIIKKYFDTFVVLKRGESKQEWSQIEMSDAAGIRILIKIRQYSFKSEDRFKNQIYFQICSRNNPGKNWRVYNLYRKSNERNFSWEQNPYIDFDLGLPTSIKSMNFIVNIIKTIFSPGRKFVLDDSQLIEKNINGFVEAYNQKREFKPYDKFNFDKPLMSFKKKSDIY